MRTGFSDIPFLIIKPWQQQLMRKVGDQYYLQALSPRSALSLLSSSIPGKTYHLGKPKKIYIK